MRTQSDAIFDGALPLSGVVVKISVHRLDQGFHARLLQPYPKKAGTKMKFLLNRPLKKRKSRYCNENASNWQTLPQ